MIITKVMSIKSQPNRVDSVKKDYQNTNKAQEQAFGMKMNKGLAVGIVFTIAGLLSLAAIKGGKAIKQEKNKRLNSVIYGINNSNLPDKQKGAFKSNINNLLLIGRKNAAIKYGNQILDSVHGVDVSPNLNYSDLISTANKRIKMRQKMIAHRDSVLEASRKMFTNY